MRIEQAELRDAARQIMEGLGPTATADTAWEAIRDAGFPALTAPEAAGGLEQPLEAASWLYLELGRALSPAALLPSLLAAEALNALPQSDVRDDWLGRIAGGERIAVSLIDPTAADVQVGADGTLTGTVTAVQGAAQADHALVAGPALLAIVPLASAQVVDWKLWDASRDLADVTLAAADGTLLARGAEADAALAALSTHLHFAIAADSVGAAGAVLDLTVDYLKQRRQYDRPLAMFQALKHRCADLKTMIAAAEALLASHLSVAESGDALTRARGAKSICSTTFRAVAEEAIQLHGGMGMTMEHPAHLYLKRALLNEHLASADDACELAVADALLEDMA